MDAFVVNAQSVAYYITVYHWSKTAIACDCCKVANACRRRNDYSLGFHWNIIAYGNMFNIYIITFFQPIV